MDKNAFRPAFFIVLVVAVLGVAAFQPAFFGDELFPYFIARTSGDLAEIYLRINQYKPRLLFNGLWAFGVWAEAPRSAFGVFNAFAMAWAGIASFAIARFILKSSIITSSIVGMCVVVSRFGMVFYYDYLSGTIGTLGLALFLTTAYLVAREVERPHMRPGVAVAAVTLSVATVLTYETYIAGVFVLGVGAMSIAFYRRRATDRLWVIGAATGLAIWLVPLLCFLIATKWMSALSVMTGTAGESVSLGLGTLHAFIQFASNVFLGTNFGHEWFVGALHAERRLGMWAGYTFAVVQAALWGWALLSAVGRWNRRQGVAGLLLLGTALATIAISSLPGIDRADARWMFPLSAFVALLVATIPNSVAQKFLLVSILVVNFFHLFLNNAEGVYNVRASKISGEIAGALRNAVPLAERGVVLGVPDNELEWVLGGNALQGNNVRSGENYCWINLRNAPCVDPRSALENRPPEDYGFALLHTQAGSPPYMIQGSILQVLLRPQPEMLAQARTLGGGDVGWQDWLWSEGAAPQEQDVSVSGPTYATLTLPVAELRRAVLGYVVSGSPDRQATMRLQVNWLRADRSFMAPQIEVARPRSLEAFAMLLLPPPEAAFGEIYVTLHDTGPGNVVFHRVALIAP